MKQTHFVACHPDFFYCLLFSDGSVCTTVLGVSSVEMFTPNTTRISSLNFSHKYREDCFFLKIVFSFTAYTTKIYHTVVVKCLRMFCIHFLHLCTTVKNNTQSENHRKSASQELSKTLTGLKRLQSLLSRYTVRK